MSNLNEEQLQAVQHGEGPLLIIAGAGTGKTTVITERIKHLILERGINPANILALTFTEKASTEMEERIDIALPYGYTQMWIETFHGFCDRILRAEAIHIGLSPNYKLMNETESVMFLRKNLFKFKLEYFRPLGNPNKFIQGLLGHFSRLKDEDISPETYKQYATRLEEKNKNTSEETTEEMQKYRELAQAYSDFENLKIQENLMDFGNLISNTLKLLRTRKHILKQYQEQFHFILIDEFQDTNYAQNQLAMLLSGERKNITAVGDDDQAIYRWRGAAISNMIQFREHFPTTKIVTLNKNYRSTANILDSAYQLIQNNNPDRLEIKENINKHLEAINKKNGEAIEFLYCQQGTDEAELVAKKIKEFVKKHKYEYRDIAILVRANDHAQTFMQAFDQQQIPYQFLGPGQLFQQEEIKDLVAYLKVLTNFEDSASMYRILTMPLWSIPATDIAQLLNMTKRKHISLFETLSLLNETTISKDTQQKLLNIQELLHAHFQTISKTTGGEMLYQFLKDSGLMKQLLEPQTPIDQIKSENIAKLFERIKEFESSHTDNSIFAITDWIELSMDMGDSPGAASLDWGNTNTVNILTIHASKGLEFPIVFIVNMVAQRFPSRERKEQIPLPENILKDIVPQGDHHLQEERRLCYVAITRAKEKLLLTASSFYGDGKRERKLSPFIGEATNTETIEKAKNRKNTQIHQLSLLDMFSEPQTIEIRKEDKDSIIHKPKHITYLSYSQIQTFEICPLHYKLKYIMKVPTPGSVAQSFGTSIHSVLRDYYTLHIRGENPTLEIIPNLVKANWLTDGYENREHEQLNFQRAIEITTNYIQKDFQPTTKPIAIELPFQFFVNELRVGGRIDRIDKLPDGTIEIIDYKTGHNIPSEKSLADNFQLSLYALASTEINDPLLKRLPEEIKLSLYYLEEGVRLTTNRTRDQLILAKEQITKTAQTIANSNFQCSKNNLCLNCEYKILCNTK